MISEEDIKRLIEEDASSSKKIQARKGQAYYDGNHDILDYRLFYFNADGKLVEDKTRSNVKIPHPFFTELVDQATQYMLSGKDGMIRSDIPELQTELDSYFNESPDFKAELGDLLNGVQIKGFDYFYAYKNADGRTSFQNADGIGVVEAKAKDTGDDKDYIIYWYIAEEGVKHTKVKHIQVWDDNQTYYYVQRENGPVLKDEAEKINPRPHIIYRNEKDELCYDTYGLIPFFRIDNNKKQLSDLKRTKPIIDDYDVQACGLSNNLADFDNPIHLVKGFEGDSLDELQHNLKTKKLIGVGEGGDLDIKTVSVPYEARVKKMEIDEKAIYRFGMGLNTAGLKDTNATTNIAIKAAYSLLDLKCSKLEIHLEQLLRKIVKVVIDEINAAQETDYQMKDVYFVFDHEIMINATENAQTDNTEAQRRQIEVNTILNVAAYLGNSVSVKLICDALDIDYDDIKDDLPDLDEADGLIQDAQKLLDGGGAVE